MNAQIKIVFAAAIAAGALLTAGGAEASKFTAHFTTPLLYSQFDNIKHPGSHVTATNIGDEVTLNPQPLPPRYFPGTGVANPGAKVGFNPQPDPPGDY